MISFDNFRHALAIADSDALGLDFCQGCWTEMGGPLEEYIRYWVTRQRICYVHFRNVTGKVPFYRETFIDDGDTDLLRVLQILHRNGFDGVIIPDHAPLLECAAPWHASMAHALGWIRAAITAVERA